MENNEQQNADVLWQEFLDIINRQLEINTELKTIVENFATASPQKTTSDLSEEEADKVRELFLEMEASMGKERAAYHSLFGIDE